VLASKVFGIIYMRIKKEKAGLQGIRIESRKERDTDGERTKEEK
jgi:hypothetical protein